MWRKAATSPPRACCCSHPKHDLSPPCLCGVWQAKVGRLHRRDSCKGITVSALKRLKDWQGSLLSCRNFPTGTSHAGFHAPFAFCSVAWFQSSHLSRVSPSYSSTREIIFPGDVLKFDVWERCSSGVMQHTADKGNKAISGLAEGWTPFLEKLPRSGAIAFPVAKTN